MRRGVTWLRNLLSICLICPLLSAATCGTNGIVIEQCINGDIGCICNDMRLPAKKQNYPRPYLPLSGQALDEWAKLALNDIDYPGSYSTWVAAGKPVIGSCQNYISTNPNDYNMLLNEFTKK